MDIANVSNVESKQPVSSVETSSYKQKDKDRVRHVVIVGAGFAGLNAAKKLAKSKLVKVTIIDRRNYHLFQPLLYQVATAGLSPAEIATPIRTVFSNYPNVEVHLANVTDVDLANKVVISDMGNLNYDYLIIACGSKHSYFGRSDWEQLSPGLKTLEQATEIRRRILLAFEMAEKEKDQQKQKQNLTFLIVGGGPTGVELAGAIAEISRYTLEADFRHIEPSRTRVILIEAGPRILASFSEKLSQEAARGLEQLGVQIWTNSAVTEVSPNGVRLGNEVISASTIIWAAGVMPSSLGQTLGVPLDKQGRVIVGSDLTVPGHPEVFVLGDQAYVEGENGKPLPGLAPVATQQGRHTARNILRVIKGQHYEPFRYKDKGQMATIGRKRAIVQFKNIQFSGFFAWLAWLVVHIYYLIGFKNRVFVFIQWTWAYITFKRGARLIVDKEWRSYPDG